MTPSVHINALLSSAAFVREIEHRHRRGGRTPETPDILDYRQLHFFRFPLARRLSRSVRAGTYQFSPLRKKRVVLGGKTRWLYQATPMDTVVAGIVARIVTHGAEDILGPRVFSYRKGWSSMLILTDIHRYVSQHRRERPDVRQRGLYVLQRDVQGYGDTIPTHDASPLWTYLQMALSQYRGYTAHHPIASLIRWLIRPEYIDTDGTRKTLTRGTPTGSPLQPVINNLYLMDLDRHMTGIPQGMYARYGDDVVFMHPDARQAAMTSRKMDDIVEALELRFSPKKKGDHYFTDPGRPSLEWPQTQATNTLEYLGCRLDFRGRISLKKNKARVFQLDIRHRIRSVLSLLPETPTAEVLHCVCQVVNQALDPCHPLCQQSAILLRHVVNDRSQLTHLDYLVALEIARAVSGTSSVKAFRSVPYRHLRHRCSLTSLVARRNAGSRHRGRNQA